MGNFLKRAARPTKMQLARKLGANQATIKGLGSFKLLRRVAELWFGGELPLPMVSLVFQDMELAQQANPELTGQEAEDLMLATIADYRASMVAESMANAGSMFDHATPAVLPGEGSDEAK